MSISHIHETYHSFNEENRSDSDSFTVIFLIAALAFAVIALIFSKIKAHRRDKILDQFCVAVISAHPRYLKPYEGPDHLGKRAKHWRGQLKIRAPGFVRLSLSHQKIKKIPPEIELFTNLKEIDLSHNELESLPQEFFDLKKLKQINLSGNENEGIYRDIYKVYRQGKGKTLTLGFDQFMRAVES